MLCLIEFTETIMVHHVHHPAFHHPFDPLHLHDYDQFQWQACQLHAVDQHPISLAKPHVIPFVSHLLALIMVATMSAY